MAVYPVLNAFGAEYVVAVSDYWIGVFLGAYRAIPSRERVIISYQLEGNYV